MQAWKLAAGRIFPRQQMGAQPMGANGETVDELALERYPETQRIAVSPEPRPRSVPRARTCTRRFSACALARGGGARMRCCGGRPGTSEAAWASSLAGHEDGSTVVINRRRN